MNATPLSTGQSSHNGHVTSGTVGKNVSKGVEKVLSLVVVL
jgi:hypothetical protein